jgi:putative lipoic acid-binding regulatory protein
VEFEIRKDCESRSMIRIFGRVLLLVGVSRVSPAIAWISPRATMSPSSSISQRQSLKLHAKAGSFFNPVPERNNSDEGSDDTTPNEMEEQIDENRKLHRQPSKARQPSTINGVPSNQVGLGFAKAVFTTTASIKKDPVSSKPYVGIGPSSLNDVTNPEYDDQGYTLYADEKTGEKSRVFEALVDYPCLFTLKIVGANEGSFVQDMLLIVATTCEVEATYTIDHTVKHNGKWASVTVKAPVKSAQMLYQLYEDVDRDPRVKFKF